MNMKTVFALIIGLILMAGIAQADAPKCYNDVGVEPSAPFILTINTINNRAFDLLLQDIQADGLIKVENILNFAPAKILILSVDAGKVFVNLEPGSDHADAVNAAVAEKIKVAAKKYRVSSKNMVLDCNGIVTGQPRAGGMN